MIRNVFESGTLVRTLVRILVRTLKILTKFIIKSGVACGD